MESVFFLGRRMAIDYGRSGRTMSGDLGRAHSFPAAAAALGGAWHLIMCGIVTFSGGVIAGVLCVLLHDHDDHGLLIGESHPVDDERAY